MKPTLLVLAAGMGSRYGGLKQLDKLGPYGATIMDYSIFDAIRSGFGKVVFVIRKDFEDDFREIVLSKYKDSVPVEVVFQSIDALPDGFETPQGRTKPWGTNHAIMMGKSAIKEPFAVINADDFYGRNTFEVMAKELMRERSRKGDFCMVAFQVGNTMSESGTVARGVCHVENGELVTVVERTAIGYDENHRINFTDENGQVQYLEPSTPVSMNMWGFTPDYFDYSDLSFAEFLSKHINEPKAEFFIPMVVNEMMQKGLATVKVLTTESKWFGVTYSEDRQGVVDKLSHLHEIGEYPQSMF